jgi:hypothetical protein
MAWRSVGALRYSSTIIEHGTTGSSQRNPQEQNPDIHWIGDWVGSRVGLETVEKILLSC